MDTKAWSLSNTFIDTVHGQHSMDTIQGQHKYCPWTPKLGHCPIPSLTLFMDSIAWTQSRASTNIVHGHHSYKGPSWTLSTDSIAQSLSRTSIDTVQILHGDWTCLKNILGLIWDLKCLTLRWYMYRSKIYDGNNICLKFCKREKKKEIKTLYAKC